MSRVLLVGLIATVLVSGLMGALAGQKALFAAGIFGLLATAIQLAAHRLGKIEGKNPRAALPRGWFYGMGLRFMGIVLVGVAAAGARETFAPIPTALGFVGVLLPLLALELRTTR